MFDAQGWIRVRSSRDAYVEGLSGEEIDALDRATDLADEALWDQLEQHLAKYGIETASSGEVRPIGLSLIKYQFHRHLNYSSGLLTLATSRNHRCRDFAELIAWIAEKGPGSYGIIYVHDDEDEQTSNAFQVWRILKGRVEVFPDCWLSPIMPTLQHDF